jgi:hypothetical protein
MTSNYNEVGVDLRRCRMLGVRTRADGQLIVRSLQPGSLQPGHAGAPRSAITELCAHVSVLLAGSHSAPAASSPDINCRQ